MHAWSVRLAGSGRMVRTARRLRMYLERSQSRDGSWTPLWFGNERAEGGRNPVYGTARVLLFSPSMLTRGACGPAMDFLLSQQNPDGGWGACRGVESSVEETAVAVEALCCKHDAWAKWRDMPEPLTRHPSTLRLAIERGVAWLIDHTDGGRIFDPAPIGLYFASLWYYEQIYPIAMTVAALTRAAKLFSIPWRGDV